MSTRRLGGRLSNIGVEHVVIGVAILVLPFMFNLLIATEVVMFAIFAMGYNLLLGYSGELSFGHSALIGIGAYAMVFGLQEFIPNLYAILVVAVIAGGLMGLTFAVISLRRRGIYFAMITLALSQMIFFLSIFFKDTTGGRDGIATPIEFQSAIGPFDPLQYDVHLFALSVVLLAGVTVFIWRVIHSPFGRSLIAIRENEERAVHLGYKPNRFLTVAFVMSGAISGLAGGLYAVMFSYVTSEVLFWVISGDVVLMTLLGGVGTLGGPIAGAVLYVILQDILVDVTNNWQLPFGIIVMLLVLFAPGGTAELYDRIRGKDTGTKSMRELVGLESESESDSQAQESSERIGR